MDAEKLISEIDTLCMAKNDDHLSIMIDAYGDVYEPARVYIDYDPYDGHPFIVIEAR